MPLADIHGKRDSSFVPGAAKAKGLRTNRRLCEGEGKGRSAVEEAGKDDGAVKAMYFFDQSLVPPSQVNCGKDENLIKGRRERVVREANRARLAGRGPIGIESHGRNGPQKECGEQKHQAPVNRLLERVRPRFHRQTIDRISGLMLTRYEFPVKFYGRPPPTTRFSLKLRPMSEAVKNRLWASFVIPAKAGTQWFQGIKGCLDPGFHRGDEKKEFLHGLSK